MPSSLDVPTWRPCTRADVPVLARMNAELSVDEGAQPVGPVSAYVERLTGWLDDGRYQAAIAESDGAPVAYVLWRRDPDYADVFVRQFFVERDRRGRGLGRTLFERAAAELWPEDTLRLDVYDSNPRGGAFWESLGFVAFSRLMRRPPAQEA